MCGAHFSFCNAWFSLCTLKPVGLPIVLLYISMSYVPCVFSSLSWLEFGNSSYLLWHKLQRASILTAKSVTHSLTHTATIGGLSSQLCCLMHISQSSPKSILLFSTKKLY